MHAVGRCFALAGLVALVLFGTACSAASRLSPATDSSSDWPTSSAVEVKHGLVLSVQLPSATLPAGTEQTATVTLRNTSVYDMTVGDIWGIRVLDGAGEVVDDPMGDAIYPAVTISLESGRSKTKAVEFTVPEVGLYRLEAYLSDRTTQSKRLRFESIGP